MSLAKVALDHCLSPKLASVLNVLYKSQGFDFIHVNEIAGPRTSDDVWAGIFTRFGGQFVLSGDSNIAYRPHQAIAFIDNQLICVFPSENWLKMKTHHHGTVLPFYWPLIGKKFSELAGSGGSCWRLPLILRDGEVVLRHTELEPLEIPADVLAKTRAEERTNRTVSGSRAPSGLRRGRGGV